MPEARLDRTDHCASIRAGTSVPREAYAPLDRGGVGPMPNGALLI